MNSESLSYTNPSVVYRFENYGSFENSGSFELDRGEVLVGVGASLTGMASLLTCVKSDNDRRCCSDVVGCAADVALISILVCD